MNTLIKALIIITSLATTSNAYSSLQEMLASYGISNTKALILEGIVTSYSCDMLSFYSVKVRGNTGADRYVRDLSRVVLKEEQTKGTCR